MRRRLGNGNSLDCRKNLAGEEKMSLPLGHIAWYVYICGVCGNTGLTKDE